MEHIYFSSINDKISKSKWIGQGATANCYKSDDNIVYKLFKDNDTTKIAVNKTLFTDHCERFGNITNHTFQAPSQIIINHNDDVLGYVYPYIEGETLDNLNDKVAVKDFFMFYRNLLLDIADISEKNFCLSDTSRRNIIFDETFHIFDLDCCSFVNKWSFDMLYRFNSGCVLRCLINSIFNKPYCERIVFFDPILNQLYDKICSGDVKSINSFIDYMCSYGCDDINPTIRTLRRSIKTRINKKNTIV